MAVLLVRAVREIVEDAIQPLDHAAWLRATGNVTSGTLPVENRGHPMSAWVFALIIAIVVLAIVAFIARVTLMRHDVAWFKDWAAGVQSVVISVAVLVGGVWTVYAFVSLRQAGQAKEQLLDATSRQKALDIDLSTSPVQFTRTGRQGLIVTATIKNSGTREVELVLGDDPLVVSRVEMTQRGLQAVDTQKVPLIGQVTARRGDQAGETYVLPNLSIQPNTTRVFPFYVELTAPGLYMLSVSAPVPQNADDSSQVKRPAWIGTELVEVLPWDPQTRALPR